MENTITDIEQAETFIKNLKRSDNWVSDDLLLHRLNQTEQLIREHHRDDLLPFLGVNFSLYHIDHGEYNLAWEYAQTARQYGEQFENPDCLLNALSLQYRIQRFLGNLEAAQEIINTQIDYAYKYNDPHQIAAAYHNQGTIHHRQRLKNDAKEAFNKSIEYITKSGKLFYISNFCISYAGVLLDFKEPNEAEYFLVKGYNIAKENNFIQSLALANSNFGLLYQIQKKENDCILAFRTCIQLFDQLKNTGDSVMAKIMLADAFVDFNRLDDAEQLLKETIVFSEQNNLKYNLIGIYDALSNLMEKKKNYKEALEYHKKLVQEKEAYLNAESEKRIQNLEHTQKLNILRIEKQNAEHMASIKHDFLANMSHEIRTPINSILGICYLLQQQSLNEVQLDYINRLKRSGENLLGIVNDVLDISKIESGKMELVQEPFSFSGLLQDVHQALEPKANEKGITFHVNCEFYDSLQLKSDPVRLYQVLLNLASNAIKFTSQGNVSIHAYSKQLQQHSTEITFIVRDTGIGIAQEKIDRIFERYEQADAKIKNTFGGTGLGLSISKKIIELMQGVIEVKSEPGKGTEFTVSIPFETTHTPVESSVLKEEIPKELLDNKRILIADDNEENRLVAKEILLHFNDSIQLFEAANGQEVLDLIEKNSVDILFMDLDMPVMNGIEATQEIRNKTEFNNIKIVGNTASLSTLSNEEFKTLGFNAFILKPYKVNLLLQIIVECLK